ncbi:hypothetical protein CcaverHIS002_0211780 [Cutaneotrichosporon cavernicola]|nr:hypothetical protein CcaverHIS002_0211780 [Cutaneotrichosporon cavernicola]
MSDDAATLIREVLPPVPDNLRSRYEALFTADDLGHLDAALEKDYPEATRRPGYDDFGGADRQATSIALDAWLTQYAAGVKGTRNPDMKYDRYLPSCFYDWLARGVDGVGDLNLNWSEALCVAGHRDVSYTDSQLFFPVAFKDRWGLVHVSYVEDRITVFDPASDHEREAQEAHIAAADKAHFNKTHKVNTRVMSAFPSRHFRDERSVAFDKLAEAIEANVPLADIVGSEVKVGANTASVRGGIRDALRDRAKFTWATGVPVNAEGIAVLGME